MCVSTVVSILHTLHSPSTAYTVLLRSSQYRPRNLSSRSCFSKVGMSSVCEQAGTDPTLLYRQCEWLFFAWEIHNPCICTTINIPCFTN